MASKELIKTEFDKFKQKTTMSSFKTELYKIQESQKYAHHNITIMGGFRYVKSPEAEAVCIDIKIWAKEWFFSGHGKIEFVFDNENYSSPANEGYSGLDKMLPGNIEEDTYYIISKEILYKIASASDLSIRISGSDKAAEVESKNVKNFQTLAKQFYNKVFDSSVFVESLSQKTSSSSSCFIATAAMGDYDHPVVMDLRFFRDNWLLKRNWGVSFTKWYYTHGPKAAKMIEKSSVLKKITFFSIVKPLHFMTNKLK